MMCRGRPGGGRDPSQSELKKRFFAEVLWPNLTLHRLCPWHRGGWTPSDGFCLKSAASSFFHVGGGSMRPTIPQQPGGLIPRVAVMHIGNLHLLYRQRMATATGRLLLCWPRRPICVRGRSVRPIIPQQAGGLNPKSCSHAQGQFTFTLLPTDGYGSSVGPAAVVLATVAYMCGIFLLVHEIC